MNLEGHRAKLTRELEGEIADARRRGKRNYYAAYGLKLAALISSIAAGALGIAELAPSKVVGIIAFIPSAAVLLSQELKLQQKANFCYGAAAAFRKIRAKCEFGREGDDSVADLALETAQLQEQLNQDWDARLNFAWGEAAPARAVK